MENRTKNYIWNIVILSIMTIGFLALSVDVGLSKKELEKEIKISTASTVHDFRKTEIDGETYYSCNKCHFTIRTKPRKDLQLYYDNSSIEATSYDLNHCENFPISIELPKKEALNFISKLDAVHDFKIDMDPDDDWISHLHCNKCGFCFRYDGHNTLSFNKDFCSFDDLMKCEE